MTAPQKVQPPTKKTKQVCPWRLIEGDTKMVLKRIQSLLERSGKKRFKIELRIFGETFRSR